MAGQLAAIGSKHGLSPRVKAAIQLHATGIAKTKKEASTMAGLHPNYLTMLTSGKNGSEEVKAVHNELLAMVENQSLDHSVIMKAIGRKALGKLVTLMDSENDHIAFKAAQDLADRAPDTSKTQRVQVDGFSLSSLDAKELAEALVESATRSKFYDQVTTKGLIEVQDVKELSSGEVINGG